MTADRATTEFVLLNDLPVGEGGNADILASSDAAVRIAKLIVSSREFAPFTIGIDAGWGMGKSSLMLQVHATLDDLQREDNKGIKPVWFNAWTSEGASALDGLIKSVLATLDENILRKSLRQMVGKRQLVAFARIALLIVASFFHFTRVVDELWDRFSADPRSRNQIKAELVKIFKTWSAKTKRSPEGRTLVVFIDDLDRCSTQVILAICEAIKLYLDVPGIVFIIACDQNILAQAAKEAGQASQAAASVAYMEKIVQITYRKPAPDGGKVSQLVDHFAELSGTSDLFTEPVKKIIVDRAGGNPRRIKRVINSFILEYRLDPEWQAFGAEALIRIILIQHFYPDFYRNLVRPSRRNLVWELLIYHSIRSSLQLEKRLSDEELRFFEQHRIKPPGPDNATWENLRRLEEEIPIDFPAMVKDDEFVSLIDSLSQLANFEELLDRLQRHPMTTVTTRDLFMEVSGSDAGESAEYHGLQVIWIDDNPDWIRDKIAELEEGGASVATATDLQSARELLSRITHPDVVISDVARQGDDNAGIKDMEDILADNLYKGQVIFYTSKLTPARKKAADSLGAAILTSREALMAALRRIRVRKDESQLITKT